MEQTVKAGWLRKSVILLGNAFGLASTEDRDNFTRGRVTTTEDIGHRAMGEQGVLGLSAAWACVNLLAGTIASLPLMVYRTDRDGRRTVASDHPLYDLLHDGPNYDQTAVDFWEFMCACIELRGNGFAQIKRGADGRIIALDVPVPPQIVAVKRLRDGSLEYRWTVGGREEVLPQEEVLHVRGFGGSPLGGLSTLSFGASVFSGAQAIDIAAAATFRNGIRPSGILEAKDSFTAEQREEAEELLQDKYRGTLNAGVPMLLDRGVTFKAITINPEDAQMLQSRAFSVEEICRLFGVPPFMVGHTEKATSWGTGIEQQTIGFVQFTLRRRLKRIEQALEKQLLTAADRANGVRIEFSLEGLLRGDSKTRADFYASGLQNGWRTINEVRALENLPPVPGGDVPRMQLQNVPITEGRKLNAGGQ
ncbi:phage portal protein [Allosphingosinicella indica]|uniref:Phage portal protein, HK97 family n=1 Tax=Allosphingosinicella indica TaxID=941907 RepID=A0A1X7GJ47_9SPHN|nr:phage portal protein [Allosphingosinicella indica]SMF70590.1 phage portal protein, HK97 family [Allosphingosinicella indica]